MGKKAFVTGSSSGIGKGIAFRLAAAGYDVAVHCGKNIENAESVVARIREMGRESIAIQADIRNLDMLNKAFDDVISAFGHIDLMVNNAGITRYKRFLEVTPDFFDDLYANNLRSHFFATQRAAKNMIENGVKGSIVTITSVQQEINLPEASVYGGFKAALFKMVKHQAMELAPYGIRVNAVAPGTIKVTEQTTPRLEQFASRTPISRLGTPEDIAPAVEFLADNEKSSFITGIVMIIDGGQYVPCLCDNTFVERIPPAVL